MIHDPGGMRLHESECGTVLAAEISDKAYAKAHLGTQAGDGDELIQSEQFNLVTRELVEGLDISLS